MFKRENPILSGFSLDGHPADQITQTPTSIMPPRQIRLLQLPDFTHTAETERR
jgi:hypothetical protein